MPMPKQNSELSLHTLTVLYHNYKIIFMSLLSSVIKVQQCCCHTNCGHNRVVHGKAWGPHRQTFNMHTYDTNLNQSHDSQSWNHTQLNMPSWGGECPLQVV